MERFYDLEGLSRQGYFQGLARQDATRRLVEQIGSLVKAYRKDKDRRAGSRSLYYNLGIKSLFDLGVNKFERLMSEHDLALAPYKSRLITTQSCVRSGQYSDLSKGLTINDINQLVVGDLTYLIFADWVYYLFLLTDVYSARIVGWKLGQRMRAVEAHEALLQWVELRGSRNIEGCVHHTDGGSQYFSNLYLGTMETRHLRISVAENCVDNGFAEQRNGLIKQHLVPTVRDLRQEGLHKEMEEMLYFYNHERKQEALGWLSPVQFEQQWVGCPSPPLMTIYNRDVKKRTVRKRVF
ncbi:MAG: DDE-type integrase/transposase/recombinase [Saprospiraceae bacterium]|nr:DDE-type integrase/transposase/recombinase [Saprospiraceae bacterium]